jgi:hypothetical protein
MTLEKTSYKDRSPRTKFIIDALAMYYTPSQVLTMLEDAREEFPEEIPSKSTIANYKIRYATDIKQRRAEISDKELPILDPAWRFLRLQEIVEESLAGKEIVTKRGELAHVKDFKSAITAVAEVNKMTGFTGKTRDEDAKDAEKLKQQILEELRADLLKVPNASPEEVDAVLAKMEQDWVM